MTEDQERETNGGEAPDAPVGGGDPDDGRERLQEGQEPDQNEP